MLDVHFWGFSPVACTSLMEDLEKENCNFWKKFKFFPPEFFTNFLSLNPGSGTGLVFRPICWIRIRNKLIRIRNNDFITESARNLDIWVGKSLSLRPALSVDLQHCVLFPVLHKAGFWKNCLSGYKAKRHENTKKLSMACHNLGT